MAEGGLGKSLEETSTWAVAVVCLVLVGISVLIEYVIHILGKWLKKKHKKALNEALEKVKEELMLMGFISLLLTVLETPITNICVSKSLAATWHPCKTSTNKPVEEETDHESSGRKLLESSDFTVVFRRSLAGAAEDKCAAKGKAAFVSAHAIHQLHIFIFVLAVVHIIYCIVTYALGKTKMRRWKAWEDETKTIEYQYYNDPERFRFARDTSFGRRHLNFWSKSSFWLWIVCFFRQFFGSVNKVDYTTLRHGFISAHLVSESETKFNFQKYINRSLEVDFKVVVGISPVIWLVAVFILCSTTHGWYSYYWLPFIPLIITLLVGTKLQVIITKMGLRIQDRGDVVKGAPLVQPGDELFWFGRPRFLLFLIHLVLFQNAFQLAFFFWSTYEFTIKSCFHGNTTSIIIKLSMGYVTLPLYALVTQMGSTMRPTVFNETVAAALKSWHHTAKKHTKHGRHSASTTPLSSRPATLTHGTSPVHLLHQNFNRSNEMYITSPDSEHWDPESLNFHDREIEIRTEDGSVMEVGSVSVGTSSETDASSTRTRHDLMRSQSDDFSFARSDK